MKIFYVWYTFLKLQTLLSPREAVELPTSHLFTVSSSEMYTLIQLPLLLQVCLATTFFIFLQYTIFECQSPKQSKISSFKKAQFVLFLIQIFNFLLNCNYLAIIWEQSLASLLDNNNDIFENQKRKFKCKIQFSATINENQNLPTGLKMPLFTYLLDHRQLALRFVFILKAFLSTQILSFQAWNAAISRSPTIRKMSRQHSIFAPDVRTKANRVAYIPRVHTQITQ